MAQSVEHILGKDEVVSSILTSSSKKKRSYDRFFFCFFQRPVRDRMSRKTFGNFICLLTAVKFWSETQKNITLRLKIERKTVIIYVCDCRVVLSAARAIGKYSNGSPVADCLKVR